MTGRRPGKKVTSRKPDARVRKKTARPALGNDPFERGAAVREPAPAREPVFRTESAPESAPPLHPLSPPAPEPPAFEPPAFEPLASEPHSSEPHASEPHARGSPAFEASVARARDADRGGARTAGAGGAAGARSASSPIPDLASLKARLGALESRVESAAAGASARLRELARQEASGQHARDLLQTWSKLLPALSERLGALASLRDLFAGKGELDAFGMDRELFERSMPLLQFLYTSWWRVEARRIENVSAEGPVIVVANHGGALAWDALVLRMALLRDHPAHRNLRPLLDDHALRVPIAGTAATRLGAVPATPENALHLLQEGSATAVFPEGSRAARRPWPQRYRVERFGRGGFAKLAFRTGAAIVPCAIVGSEETSAPFARAGWLAEALGVPFLAAAALPLAPLGLIPLPSRWSLRFGEPIDTRAAGPGAADDAARVLEVTERARASLQQMLDEDVAARRSVYL